MKSSAQWRSEFANSVIPPEERIRMVQRDAVQSALSACRKPEGRTSQWDAGFDAACNWVHQDLHKLLWAVDHPSAGGEQAMPKGHHEAPA